MANLYCDTSDLYDFGLPRGAVRNPSRRVASVSTATNMLELEGHGLGSDSLVSFRAEAGGSLCLPIVAGTQYYAQPTDDDHFAVSATAGGAALDLTTEGSRILMITPLPIEAKIEYASELVNDVLPAHVVPLTAPFPPIVRMTVAEIAAASLGYYAGGVSKSMADMVDAAQKRIARWAKGTPIRGDNAPAAARLSSVAVSTQGDARGWSRYGGTI